MSFATSCRPEEYHVLAAVGKAKFVDRGLEAKVELLEIVLMAGNCGDLLAVCKCRLLRSEIRAASNRSSASRAVTEPRSTSARMLSTASIARG
jgi:hypothetical protein